jgi:hypothetical protein
MKLYFFKDSSFNWDSTDGFVMNEALQLNQKITMGAAARYFRLRYNPSQFKASVVTRILKYAEEIPDTEMRQHVVSFIADFDAAYKQAKPYTYTTAFAIPNAEWRALVFGSIRVSDMIAELGHRRIATAGRPVRHKQYTESGEFAGYRDYDVVFETHQVDGEKLGVSAPLYAVRCWCTTTESEHWIWIESKYAESPLEAIASTFRIHESVIPYIKELKRQGDILLVELTQLVEPRGAKRPLTQEEYFSLLTAQS